MVQRLVYSIVFLAALVITAQQNVLTQTAPRNSTITIHVGKAGIFSGFGHNHTISAPVAHADVDPKSKTAAITVRAREMKVVDTELSEKDRAEIQATMLGPKVLDAEKFPEIRFTSTSIEQTAPEHFRVTGKLELHGVTKQLEIPVTGTPDHYTGKTKLKQTDFGIQPVTAAGGAVKVKDEMEIDFDIYPAAQP